MHQRDRGNRHTWSVAGSHHLRFKFFCVSAPFAPTQGGILVNSVHLSTYSLSGHDAPKAAASIQDAITGCLPCSVAGSTFESSFPNSPARKSGPFKPTEPTVIVGTPVSFLAHPARFKSDPVNSGSQYRRVDAWNRSTPASASGASNCSSCSGVSASLLP